MADNGWVTLPFDQAVLVNPPVRLERGEVYPFVDMQAVDPGSRSVGPSELREFKGGGSRFMNGDTLMARITPCLENGKIARYAASKAEEVGHGSTEFIVIRGRPNVTDNGFAYYLTKWDGVRQYCISQMTGSSGRQRVPTSALSHHEVTIPPLKEQQAIACILGALDDKIELNRRMNRTLEEMARAIFKSWFVDFDPVHWNSARRLANIPRSEPGKWFIYAIECEGGSHYIGFTDDLHRRFDEHCRGCGADWTKAHPPVRLAYWEPVDSQAEAVAREQKLKSGSGREWLKAEIARNWTPRRPLPAGRQVKPEIAALFPDSFEPSELGEIPKGWRVDSLDGIANYLNGLALQKYPPKNAGTLPVIKIAQLRKGDSYGADLCSANLPTDYIIQDGDVLFSWSGSLEVEIWCGGAGALNQHLFKVTSHRFKKWFFFLWTLHHLNDFRLIAADKATTMGHIQRKHLSDARVLIPSKPLMDSMDNLMDPLVERVVSCRLESRTLAALRDTLLPKLISGELRVPDVERIAGRCL